MHQKTLPELYKIFQTSDKELNEKEVQKKMEEYGENIIQVKKKKSWVRAFLEEFADLMVIILIAAAIIAVVGLLSLLVYRFIGGPEKALNIDYEFSNSEINSLGNALDRQDLAACENAGQLSNYCEGVLEQNTEKCKRYGGDLGDACIMRIANKNKDPTLCGNLQVLKGLCFEQLAMETGDIRLCDAAEEYKNDCKTALSK